MKQKFVLASLLLVLSSFSFAAPVTLEGMNQIMQWTDYENQSGEMPGFIWGTSDSDNADQIGLYVEFANGLTGSVTYSGVSGLWNQSSFSLAADTATGFFTNASNMHILFNNAPSVNYPQALAIAWESFVMDFSNNFDLDYNEDLGSNFRASVAGWESATFTTYSSTASAVPVPAAVWLFGSAIASFAGFSRFKKKA